jgi:hypothetical protein
VTAATGSALATALAYHRAWTSKDLDLAMTFVDPDVVCDAPAGRITGAQAYRAFLAPLVGMLLDARLLGAFGNDEAALVMYDTRTTLVEHGPGAELVHVRHGRIVRSWFLFDRLPFAQARGSSGPATRRW